MQLLQLSILSWLTCQAVLSPVPPDDIFKYIDDHKDEFVQRLTDWVAIESDSSDPTKRDQVNNMMEITKDFIIKLGGKVEMAELGEQVHPSGMKIPLPPVILAEIGNDPNKPTVCFYGHVDVQSAKKEDGWLTEPYTVVDKDGNLYGRGTSDDKGQILALLHAVEAGNTIGLPVNVKFLIEGMEEVGSNGLDTLVEEKKDTFFANVDYIVVTDTPWLSKRPGITYGARGNCYFLLEVKGARRDLHSGGFGGTVYEAMNDLIYLLDTLADVKGHINIPGIYNDVAPLSEKEINLYKGLEFDLDDLEADTGIKQFLHNTKEELLLYRWRYPSLSIHGIEGAFSGPGSKTVIPASVIGKFSIRQVPNMNPSVVEKQVKSYLEIKFAERKSPNVMNVSMIIGAKPWLADMNGPQYLAARRAVKRGTTTLKEQNCMQPFFKNWQSSKTDHHSPLNMKPLLISAVLVIEHLLLHN
uniref:Peptidase M20 dimerisation domain-containing protein n=1 Tax=Leptobrachium leishanense TaxID=445787 RepID=A0A8C5M6S0_9ANUR